MYFAHPTPWCQSNWSEAAIGKANLCTFTATDTIDACFGTSNATVQRIRQCSQDETPFCVLLLAVIVVFNLASLFASLRLNKIINYVELYKTSKKFLGCRTQPILHRAETKEDSELFDEIFQDGKDLSKFINRPNSSGRTPLYNACERQSARKVLQLLSAGADVNQTIASGQTALHIACVKQSAEISLELLNAGAEILPDGKVEGPKIRCLLGLDGSPRGIQHVVESPDLLNLLQIWSVADRNVKEEAEQRVIEKFDKETKVLTIPLSADMGREEKEGMKEIVRKWNRDHTAKCEYLLTCIKIEVWRPFPTQCVY